MIAKNKLNKLDQENENNSIFINWNWQLLPGTELVANKIMSEIGIPKYKISEHKLTALRCVLLAFFRTWKDFKKTNYQKMVAIRLSSTYYIGRSTLEYGHKSYKLIVEFAVKLLKDKGFIALVQKGFKNRETGEGKVSRYVYTDKLERLFSEYDNLLRQDRLVCLYSVKVKGVDKKKIVNRVNDLDFHEYCISTDLINTANTKDNSIYIEYDVVIDCVRRIELEVDSIIGSSLTDIQFFSSSKERSRKIRKLEAQITMLDNIISTQDKTNPQVCNVSKMWRFVRVFNENRFDRGGRYYADFSRVKSELRRHLQINGSPTIEWDYSRHHPRILYAMAGLEPPRDPYKIGDHPAAYGKYLFFALFNCEGRDKSLKSVQSKINEKKITGNHSAEHLLKEGEAHFSALSEFFYIDNSRRLQYEDSVLATNIMTHFARNGKACLGVHDSFIVESTLKDELYRVMMEEFSKRYNGYLAVVKEK